MATPYARSNHGRTSQELLLIKKSDKAEMSIKMQGVKFNRQKLHGYGKYRNTRNGGQEGGRVLQSRPTHGLIS